jgi:kynurenine formamidase
MHTFTVGIVLAVTLFLYAAHRPDPQPTPQFKDVVDLTQTAKGEAHAALVDAPARLIRGSWTPGTLPPQRLIGPLVVMDVTSKLHAGAQYQITPDDIADWEHTHGMMPPNAIVVARTNSFGHAPRNSAAGFSLDSAQFLVEARRVLAIGTDAADVTVGSGDAVDRYTFERGVYHIHRLEQLDRVPATGAIAIVAPAADGRNAIAPARVLVLVR